MLQEMADAQGREGKGVPGITALVNEALLREFESSYLTGRWVTLGDYYKALDKAEAGIKAVVPYRPGEWAAVIPIDVVRQVLISIVKVPGRQHQLGLEGAIADEAKVERRLLTSTRKQADEIAQKIWDGASYEKYKSLCKDAHDEPRLVQMLRAFGPGSPNIHVDGGRFASLEGKPLPKTLRSDEVQKLRVRVASVNIVDGKVLVTIQKVLAGEAELERVRHLVPIKCTGAENLRILIAALLADEEAEIHVGGELPTFSGSSSYDLQLLRIVEGAELLVRSIGKVARSHQMDL